MLMFDQNCLSDDCTHSARLWVGNLTNTLKNLIHIFFQQRIFRVTINTAKTMLQKIQKIPVNFLI